MDCKTDTVYSFFEKLEAEGVIQLPPVDTAKQNKCRVRRKEYKFDTSEQKGEVGDYEQVRLVIARSGEELIRWSAYVEQYHILGDKIVFGSRLQYFAKCGETELGCMQLVGCLERQFSCTRYKTISEPASKEKSHIRWWHHYE